MKTRNMFQYLKYIVVSIVVLGIFFTLWQLLVNVFHMSEFLLPGPMSIFRAYGVMMENNRLSFHTWVTIEETLIGFFLGTLLGVLLGYITSKAKLLELIFSPFIIGAQTTPKFALAPLFLIWFGFGILSKIFITALIVFFPIFINTVLAIKSVNSNLRDIMRLSHASNWQVLTKLEIPSSFPTLFAGLKSGITLAVVGAVVGEFVGANAGLGYLIIFATGNLDTPTVFAAIIQLVIIGIVLYEIVSITGSRFIKWHESEKLLVEKYEKI